MKDATKLFPIGTVVLLNGAEKKVMITGFYSIAKENQSKIFDYVGCLYPEGMLTSEKNILFDHNQIAQIFYKGYESEEEKAFKNKINEVINTPQQQ